MLPMCSLTPCPHRTARFHKTLNQPPGILTTCRREEAERGEQQLSSTHSPSLSPNSRIRMNSSCSGKVCVFCGKGDETPCVSQGSVEASSVKDKTRAASMCARCLLSTWARALRELSAAPQYSCSCLAYGEDLVLGEEGIFDCIICGKNRSL